MRRGSARDLIRGQAVCRLVDASPPMCPGARSGTRLHRCPARNWTRRHSSRAVGVLAVARPSDRSTTCAVAVAPDGPGTGPRRGIAAEDARAGRAARCGGGICTMSVQWGFGEAVPHRGTGRVDEGGAGAPVPGRLAPRRRRALGATGATLHTGTSRKPIACSTSPLLVLVHSGTRRCSRPSTAGTPCSLRLEGEWCMRFQMEAGERRIRSGSVAETAGQVSSKGPLRNYRICRRPPSFILGARQAGSGWSCEALAESG